MVPEVRVGFKKCKIIKEAMIHIARNLLREHRIISEVSKFFIFLTSFRGGTGDRGWFQKVSIVLGSHYLKSNKFDKETSNFYNFFIIFFLLHIWGLCTL